MKLVGLISGGKDSIFNMLQCIAAGHEIIAVANIEPAEKVELDSYMYQSVGHEALTLIAGALSLPIYRYKTKGKALCLDKTYTQTPLDEVEDLYELLQTVKKDMPIDGVSVGAIASDYQRTRVENVCYRLNLKCFAFLWKRDQAELLQEMIDAQLDAIIIKVASIGLDPLTHLGKHISEVQDNLMELNQKFGVNVCGEGGEYETLTLDCPLFHRVISIRQYENKIQSNDAFAPVGFLSIKSADLKGKHSDSDDPVKSLQARIEHIRSVVKNPYHYIKDCMETVLSDDFPESEEEESAEKEIPFPFASKERKETTLAVSEDRRNKEMSQRSLNSQRAAFDSSSVTDTINSNLNFSTGWCCIGNITASNFVDAFFLLKKHLERNNYEFEDIIFVSVFLRHMSEFSALNKTYSQFMPDVLPPSRVCVATELPPNVGIIMLVVAHKLVSKSQKALHSAPVPEREVIHVQSISHWAPANIGPYSQCVKVGEIYYLAGQIPLIPGTMEMFNKSIYHQCLLTLRHVIRIMQASNEQLTYSNIFQAICYVTSEEITHDVKSFWTSITNNESSSVTVFVVTELPRKASLEWEVLACGSGNPKVEAVTQTTDDFVLQMKRCVYTEPYALSFLCKASFAKKVNKDEKNLKIITESAIHAVINHCLQFGRKDVKASGTSLCILKLFYKSNVGVIGSVIRDIAKICFDSKVVMTAIPVIACENSDIIFTITGVGH